jgi:hypothetical protein
MKRLVRHLQHNVVAYLALFVALGGTSYAAVAIKNNSINPIKLNRKYIGGYIRAWASVDASGRVVAGSAGAHVIVNNAVSPGLYFVLWRHQRFTGCVPQAGLLAEAGTTATGFILVSSVPVAARRGEVDVATTDESNNHMALPFHVSVLCPTP